MEEKCNWCYEEQPLKHSDILQADACKDCHVYAEELLDCSIADLLRKAVKLRMIYRGD